MGKVSEFFKADQIRVALVAGFCIIAMAVLFKRILHIEVDSLITNSPSYIVIIYMFAGARRKPEKAGGWILWSLIIVACTILAVIVNVV